MTTKKVLLIVGVVVFALGLLVAVFVGGIVGVALYSIGNSEAAEVSKKFLRQNQRLKDDIGEVKDFGSIVTGNINVANSSGSATLNFKVIGDRRTTNASVQLMFQRGEWRVTEATYKNAAGQTVDLLNIFEAEQLSPLTANHRFAA